MYLHDSLPAPTGTVRRRYDATFQPTEAYTRTLPDVLHAPEHPGAPAAIQEVGISNLRLPLRFRTAAGKTRELDTSVTGTASVAATLRGIHMGRIVRLLYEQQKRPVDFTVLRRVLTRYLAEIETDDVRLKLSFAYPLRQHALRSKLAGYQYYSAAMEATLDRAGRFRRHLEFDFVYASTCPCSAELSEHARETRQIYAVPHAQRSKARIKVELAPGAKLTLEDLHRHCLDALKTETQVMVKRVDEQAFAELNGAHLKFVEDAARLLYAVLAGDARIADFQAACAHLESLHSHDAVSAICKGVPGGYTARVDDFRSLIC